MFCKECNRSFRSIEEVEDHVIAEHGPNPKLLVVGIAVILLLIVLCFVGCDAQEVWDGWQKAIK